MKTVLIFVAILVMTGSVFAQQATPMPLATPPITAKQGDTVEIFAKRHGADPIEVAKYNGLLPKTKLPVGTIIRLPSKSRCDLGIENSPAIRGLKLGMEEKDADILLGKLRWGYQEDDDTSWATTFPSDREGFEGVSSVQLKSFYAKVYQINATYDVKWKSINEFVDNFSPKLGVPRDAWEPYVLGARMPCKNFDIVLSWSYTSGDIILTDNTVVKQIADKKQKLIDAKKKAIKP